MTPQELLDAWKKNREDLGQAQNAWQAQHLEVERLVADEQALTPAAANAATALQATRQTLAEVHGLLAERSRLEGGITIANERLRSIEQRVFERAHLSAMASGGAIDHALLEMFTDGLADLSWPPLDASIQELRRILGLLRSGDPLARAQLPQALAMAQTGLDALRGQTLSMLGADQAALAQVVAHLANRPDLATLETQEASQDQAAQALGQALAATLSALASARAREGDLTAEVLRLSLAVPLTSGLVSSLDPTRPLALLPARLETRFFEPDPPSGTQVELRVRVYPDDVHQDSLERELRQAEVDRGQQYWREVWAAGRAAAGRAEREKAWSDFVRDVGPERAAWIARSIRPANDRSDPSREFRSVIVRTTPGHEPARVSALPDRWVVMGYKDGGRVFAVWGHPIAGGLLTTPSIPQSGALPGEWIDDGTRWMVDFDTAEAAGMGIRVRLDRRTATDGLDILLAVGVTATMDPDQAGEALERLLESHRYTAGLGFVSQGTPTNHTEAERAPPVSPRGLLGAFREEHEAPVLLPGQAADPATAATFANGSVMARALGLLPRAAAGACVFEGLVDAALPEQLWAHDMNLLSWPATWGYFLDQMMGDVLIPMVGDTLGVSDPNRAIDAWRPYLDRQRAFFASYVRARGPLPALRVGRQPYGVLPVTSLDLWRPAERAGQGLWLFEQDGNDLFVRKSAPLAASGGGLAWSREQAEPSGHAPPGVHIAMAELEGDGRLHAVGAFPGPLRLQVTPTRDPATGLMDDSAPEQVLPFVADRVAGLACLDLDADGAATDVLVGYDTRAGGTEAVLGRGLDRQGNVGSWNGPFPLPAPPAGAAVLGSSLAAADLDGQRVVLPRPPTRPSGGLPPLPPGLRPLDTTQDARPHVVFVRALSEAGRNRLEILTGPVVDTPGLVGGWARGELDLDAFAADFTAVPALDVAIALTPREQSVDLLLALSDGTRASFFRLKALRPSATFDGSPEPLLVNAPGPWRRLAGLSLGEGGRVRGASLRATPDDFGNLLEDLRSVWRQHVNKVPSLDRGRRESDVDRALLEATAMEGASSEFLRRPTVGPLTWYQLLWANSGFPGAFPPALDNWRDERDRLHADLAATLRIPLQPLLPGPVRLDWFRLGGLGFLDPGPISLPPAAGDNVFSWLRRTPPSQIPTATPGANGVPPDSLLFRVLRHATLWAYADTAFQVEPPAQHPEMLLALTRDPELIDFLGAPAGNDTSSGAGPNTLTPWRYLIERPAPGPDVRGDNLFRNANALTGYVALRSLLAALERLGAAKALDPDLLLAETLDLSSHRLDAWITALAAQRLDELRRNQPRGINLGGYGWVLNLRMRQNKPVSTGYLHAPSLAHAATAAVLRSGFLGRTSGGSTAGGELLSLDLASGRVRLALELLEGVRQGQPLGALLGYRFERGLRDEGLGALTPVFRRIAPLAAGKRTERSAADEPVEAVAANNVADGLALLNLGAGLWTQPDAPGPTSRDGKAVQRILDSLAAAADAVRDLTLAEGVYQMVRGRPQRAAAVLDGVSRGEAVPEIEFAETPRTGTSLTFRALTLMAPGNPLPSEWAPSAARPRAAAEPTLNGWLARLWGDPARFTCTAEHPEALGSTVKKTRSVSLADLDLCPLDLLAFPPSSAGAKDTELEQRVRLFMETLIPTGLDVTADVTVSFERPGKGLGFLDLLTLVGAFRRLLSLVRALAPEDLAQGGAGPAAASVKLEELERRDAAAGNALRAAAEVLAEPASDEEAISGALETSAGFGVAGASSALLAKKDARPDAVRVVAAEAAQRLSRLKPLPSDPATLDAGRRLARATENLRVVFGNALPILPHLDVTAAHAALLSRAAAARAAAGDASAPLTAAWLKRTACVREAVAGLEKAFVCVRAAGAGKRSAGLLSGQVLQLPPPAPGNTDAWVALPTRDPRADWPANPVSIIAYGDLDELAGAAPTFAGLWIDEWTELVPSRSETTGWVFHFDAPGAAAPQAILLAVPPQAGRRWDLRKLEAILLGTIDLAQARLVDLDALAGHDLLRFLPAAYLASNPGHDTIAANVNV